MNPKELIIQGDSMRHILLAMLIVILTCSFASAKSIKVLAKPQVKGTDAVKGMMQDKILNLYFSQSNDRYYFRATIHLHKEYAPNTFRLSAEQSETPNGPWKTLSRMPSTTPNNLKIGSHHFSIAIDEPPNTSRLRVTLSVVENGTPMPAHVSKIYKLGCTCLQVLP